MPHKCHTLLPKKANKTQKRQCLEDAAKDKRQYSANTFATKQKRQCSERICGNAVKKHIICGNAARPSSRLRHCPTCCRLWRRRCATGARRRMSDHLRIRSIRATVRFASLESSVNLMSSESPTTLPPCLRKQTFEYIMQRLEP